MSSPSRVSTFDRQVFSAIFAVTCFGVAQGAISVTSAGAVETFDSLPPSMNWSSGDGTPNDLFEGGAGESGNEKAQAYDEMTNWASIVDGVTAAQVNGALDETSDTPGNTNNLARWNSSNMGLQTRPTGNRATTLLATLVNDSGSSTSSVSISYDFVVEDNAGDEQVPGFQAFYSVAGDGSDWMAIPEFTGLTGSAPSVNLTPTGGWNPGDNLYILWVDDNAASNNGTVIDDGLLIDNFTVVVPEPSSIVLGALGLLAGIGRRRR